KDLKDTDGRPIAARDFTTGVYRAGGEPRDLYYRIATGLDGTPMPAYGDVLSPADAWDVVAYVRSLAAPHPPAPLPADPIAAGRSRRSTRVAAATCSTTGRAARSARTSGSRRVSSRPTGCAASSPRRGPPGRYIPGGSGGCPGSRSRATRSTR